jgi:cytochrome c-type biogenesis protein
MEIQAMVALPILSALQASGVASSMWFLSLTMAVGSGAAVAPLALAFGAGVLAVFNPCGFALLPAFISYASGLGETDDTAPGARQAAPPLPTRLVRGALLGVPLTASFLLVFLVAGGALAAGGRALAQVFPWLGLVVGVALVLLGVRLLLPGATVEVPLLSRIASAVSGVGGTRGGSRPSRDTCCDEVEGAHASDAAAHHPLRAAWGFGLGYGLSSLGCTLPVFLLVVGSAIASGGLAQAVVVFGAYAAGMAVVLLGVALVATTLGDVLRQSMLPLLRWVRPLSALLILAAGIYIVVYQVRTGLLIH